MIKQAFTSLLIAGSLLGASAMYPLFYSEPLTDYSIQGITEYTSLLYGLGPSIFQALFGVINNTFRPVIDLITVIVTVIQDIFNWLSEGLVYIIDFFSGWWS